MGQTDWYSLQEYATMQHSVEGRPTKPQPNAPRAIGMLSESLKELYVHRLCAVEVAKLHAT
eukprot:5313564-Amphidinium_carterae.2